MTTMDDDADVRTAVRAAGQGPPAATRQALKATVLAALAERAADPKGARFGARHRRVLLVGAALAAAAVAVAVVVVSDREDPTHVVTGGSTAPSASTAGSGSAPPATPDEPPATPPVTPAVTTGAEDRLSGWPAPPTAAPGLASVPRLLPAAPVPGAPDVTRYEYADQPADSHDYSQLWVGGPDGNGALLVRTHIGQHPGPTGGGAIPVDVAGWDTAWVTRGADGIDSVVLDDPSGMVTMLGTGLSEDLTALAGRLVRPEDGRPGWDLGLDSSFVPVHEGWGSGAAARIVTWADTMMQAQLTTMWGEPGLLDNVFGRVADGPTGTAEVGGVPAVTYRQGNVSVVAWSPEPDVVAQLALVGPADDALALARSVEPVDEATWDAITPRSDDGDGCQSLLC
jgi:hypothetical protein